MQNWFRKVENPYYAFSAEDGTFQIDGDVLRDAFKRTAFAAASEETRYAIHGILLEVDKGQMRLTATDGKRLSTATGAAHKAIKGISALVPPRALVTLFSAFPKGTKRNPRPVGPVAVSVEEKRILMSYGPLTVVACIIDGTFPAYDEVIPKQTANAVSTATADLADAIKDAALLASDGSQAVSLAFGAAGITLGAKASNVGDCNVEIDADGYSGKPAAIHFNPKYLLDFLKVCGSDRIDIEFNDVRSAVKFTPSGDASHVYIVMPVTLES